MQTQGPHPVYCPVCEFPNTTIIWVHAGQTSAVCPTCCENITITWTWGIPTAKPPQKLAWTVLPPAQLTQPR